MATDPKFVHVAVERATRRKITLLATVLDQHIYDLVNFWADQEWKTAVRAGLVKDSMLKAGNKEAVES